MSGATFTTSAVATAIVVQAIAGNASGVTTFKNGGTTINGGLTMNNSQSVGGISMANTTANNIGYVTAPSVGFSLPVRTFLCPNPGSGYTSATVTISAPSPGPGTTALATAVVANGKITSITITNGGTNYTAPPTITINGVGGTGVVGPTITIPAATATVTNGMVSGFTITNGGADYIAAPTITLTGGTPSAAGAAPTCRIGLYNVNYSTTGAPTGFTNPIAVTEGPEIPANRKINILTLSNAKHLTLNDNLELTAASGAISLTGIVYFSGLNNTITCSNPGYAGT
nr:hypothetical protein [Bacteroidia bacterium]